MSGAKYPNPTAPGRLLANGKRRITVDLAPCEELIVIRSGAHYMLGYPVEDVVASHILADATEVTWCSASQEWVA